VKFDILSLFPDYFDGPFKVSMLKRAQENGLIKIELTDIRDFAEDKHQRVDDRPLSESPGMVLMPEPLTKAIRSKERRGHT
jgi:tRNA (guanine37-N1)-methyltransferase